MAIINCYDVNGNAIKFLTQWDHDISIRTTGVKTSPIPEFRFSNKYSQKSKCISGVVVSDGVKATIPNGFLQEALPIYVQLFYTYPSGDAKTEHTFVIPVKPASMPDGAVYEPVEVRSIVELERRVKALEENGVPGAGGVPSDPSFDTVGLGGDTGVVIISEGTADAPAITFYGAHGDEPVALNNVADATDDRSAPNLGQVKQLVEAHSGQNPPQNGEDGFSPIATVTQTATGATISITDANGTTTATVTNGKDGRPGRDGYTPQKGVDYFDGQPGKDGADGEDGYTPVKGKDYFDGEDGQNGSPGKDGNGIKSAVLNADYTLTLTFDDGTSYTTPSIRGATGAPGSAGKDGNTPGRGVDYWTAADQEAIVQQVIAALGTPVFGRVDGENNIILTGELADGTYVFQYEDGEGNVVEIGTMVKGQTDDSGFVTLEYKFNTKIDKTTGEEAADSSNTYHTHQLIPYDSEYDYLVTLSTRNAYFVSCAVCWYDAGGQFLGWNNTDGGGELKSQADGSEFVPTSANVVPMENAASFKLRIYAGGFEANNGAHGNGMITVEKIKK